MTVYVFDEFEFDDARHSLLRGGERVAIRPQVVTALSLLLRRSGELVTRAELEAALWPDVTVVPNALDQLVRRVRRALGAGGRRYLRTVPGQGYRFEGAVERVRLRAQPSDSDLVGREAELAALEALGPEPTCVVGPAGVGKTRLCLELLRAGGVLVPLEACANAEDVLASIAEALDLPLGEADSRERVACALEVVDGPVVLDNAEHVAAAVAEVAAAVADRCRLIVTSRVPLDLPGGSQLRLEPLLPPAARTLFCQRARAELDGEDARIGAIVERLDRLPLAIELAAAQLPVFGLAELDEVVLSTPHGTDAMTAALERSWQLLDPWCRSALSQLTAFRTGATLEALAAVLALGEAAPPVAAVVAELFAHSLVRVEALPSGRRRYAPFQVVRDFVARTAPPGPAVLARHAAWFARYGREPELAALHTHGGLARRRALAEDLDELLCAADRAEGEEQLHARVAAVTVLLARGPYPRARPLVEGAEDPRLRELAGRLAALCGRHEQARALLAACVEASTGGAAARCGAHLAVACAAAGDTEAADAALERALTQVEPSDPVSAALVHATAAHHFLQTGRLARARTHGERALAIAGDHGDAERQGAVLGTLGILHLRQGRVDRARALYEQALAVRRDVGDRRAVAHQLQALGNLALESGDRGTARRYYGDCLAEQERLGNRRGIASVLIALGVLAQESGEPQRAREQLERSAWICAALGDRGMEAYAVENLGALHLSEGRAEEALAALRRAKGLAEEAGNTWFAAVCAGQTAAAHTALGELDAAEALLGPAEAALRAQGDPYQLARLLATRARLCMARGRSSEALLAEAEALVASRGAGGSLRAEIHALRQAT